MISDLFNLQNKNILITGASSGIGKDLSIKLDQLGCNVFITGRNEERLNETKNILFDQSKRVPNSYVCDLTQINEIEVLSNTIPILDGVVFCAGIVEYTPVKFLNEEKINKIFSINFTSQVILTQQLLKNKKIKSGSSIVYISSISSKIGVPGTSIYSASKSAINAFMKVTASELSNKKIRVNSICPGSIKTPMVEKAFELNSNLSGDYPLGLGETSDVLGACIFLLSDAGRWITGTEIILDGGLTIK